MKKLIVSIALALAATFAFADLYPSKRFVEVGVNAKIGANQNLLTLPDIFSETINLDLTKMYKGLNGNDMKILVDGDADVFFKFQFGPIGGGLNVGIDSDVQFGITNGFFKLLGVGNTDDNISLGLGVGAQVYLTADLLAKFKVGRLGFTVRPTMFLPVAYMPYSTVQFSLDYNESDGYILSGGGEVGFYCPLNLTGYFSTTTGTDGTTSSSFDFTELTNSVIGGFGTMVSDLFNQSGFNLSACVEYPIFNTLDIGAFTRIPVVPARLKYGSSAYARLKETKIGNISDLANGGSLPSFSTDMLEYGISQNGTGALNDVYIVNMPFRLGAEGAWRPFGKWLTFRPMIGFGTRNPFGEDTKGWDKFWANTYMEYGFGAELTILYLLGIDFAHEYVQQVYTNSLGVRVNIRLVEIDVKVSTSSTDFTKCWNIAGATATVGVHVGI